MMKKESKAIIFVIALIAIPVFLVSSGWAQGKPEEKSRPTIELEVRYWFPELSGSVKAVSADVGSGVDYKDDLGLEDEGIPEGRITWYPGSNHRVRLSYFQVGYEGDNRLEKTITFRGREFTVGTTIESTADIKDLKLGWAWQFINLADGKIKLGTLLEGGVSWVDYSIKDTSTPLKTEKSYTVPVAAIGFALDVAPWKWMDAFLDLSGLPLGKYGHTLNVEGGVKIIPIKNVSVFGGYRYSDIKYEDDPDFLKLRLSGPFVGATLRF
jgi:hypothetical protein